MPIGIPTKETNAETKTHPESKIRQYSIKFKAVKDFFVILTNDFALFPSMT